MHWKITENHTENFSLLFKYWSLHFANHTEKLLITLKKYCAVLQCNHVENHLRWLRWISVLIIGKRLNTENTLKYLWKIFRVTQFLCVGQFSWIFRVTLKFSVWFSVLKFHSEWCCFFDVALRKSWSYSFKKCIILSPWYLDCFTVLIYFIFHP